MTRYAFLVAALVAGSLRAADDQAGPLAVPPSAPATSKAAALEERYRIFRGNGTPATIDELAAAAKQCDVVFLGENHDDAVAHGLELEILTRLAGPTTILSLEMFERDVQQVVDEYLAGLITEEHLMASGRAWKNYKSDYRPLIEFAKKNQMMVVAANAPRRYVNRVTRMGQASLADLSKEARKTLPSLPYADASPAYAKKFQDFMEEVRRQSQQPPPVDPVWQLQAQSLWDASMADSIANALKHHDGSRVVHVNGSFHTEGRMGILDHLKRYRAKATTLVVSMQPNKSFPDWDNDKLANLGDFVIVTRPATAKAAGSK